MEDFCFCTLLSNLRLLSMYYQTCHWQVKGSLFYGDHLMFDRLYNAVNEEVDGVAERAVGFTGDRSLVNLNEVLKRMSEAAIKLPFECSENIHYVNAALLLEQDLLAYLEQHQDYGSVGVKNLLAGIADAHESNVYLLKQRLAK
jgi:DNA-binding ferritin-like protein